MIEHDVTDEGHRDGCADCAAVWQDLERISAEARALPLLSPSRDLWAGIDERISARSARGADGATLAPTRAPGRWFHRPVVRLAMAASLLVAATATVTWRLATSAPGRDLPVALAAEGDAGASLAPDDAARRDLPVSYEREFGTMDREIRALEAVVATQRDRLDPETVAILERNLRLIDGAIAESRAAFLKDPASRFLATQLARSYASKLTLLRDLATLPAGT